MAEPARDSSTSVIVGIVAIVAILILVYLLFLRQPAGDDADVELDLGDPTEQVEPTTPTE